MKISISKNKKIILFALLATITFTLVLNVFTTVWGAHYEPLVLDGDYRFTINGQTLAFNDSSGHPKLLAATSRILIPIRIVTENMGYQVDWNSNTQTASIYGNGTNVEISIGNALAKVNGKQVAIDVQNGVAVDTKAMLLKVNGEANPRTYVPLRFLSETMGAQIGYENVNGIHSVSINTDGIPATPFTPVDPYAPGQNEITGDIVFNPATDLDENNHLTEAKSAEYLKAIFDNLSIIRKNGNYYLKYDAVSLPQNVELVTNISVNTSTGLSLSSFYSTEQDLLPAGESFELTDVGKSYNITVKQKLPSNQGFEVLLSAGKIYPDMEAITISVFLTDKNIQTGTMLNYVHYTPTNRSEYGILGQSGVIETDNAVDTTRLFGDLFQ